MGNSSLPILGLALKRNITQYHTGVHELGNEVDAVV